MDFITLLKNKQRELMFSTPEFANYLGKHRSWLNNIYNENGIKRPLREGTMREIHNKLGIPREIMDEYNKEMLESRGK